MCSGCIIHVDCIYCMHWLGSAQPIHYKEGKMEYTELYNGLVISEETRDVAPFTFVYISIEEGLNFLNHWVHVDIDVLKKNMHSIEVTQELDVFTVRIETYTDPHPVLERQHYAASVSGTLKGSAKNISLEFIESIGE